MQQSALGEQEPPKFFGNCNNYANVRSDQAYYGRSGNPVLNYLTAAHYNRVTPQVYGRVTAGFLKKSTAVSDQGALGARGQSPRTRDREFEDGRKTGGYFTLTDMPFDQFGEGSFG